MTDKIQELKKTEKLIQDMQTKKSRLEGRKAQLEKDLKTKFNVTTLEEANTLLQSKKEELQVIDQHISEKLTEMNTIIAGSNV